MSRHQETWNLSLILNVVNYFTKTSDSLSTRKWISSSLTIINPIRSSSAIHNELFSSNKAVCVRHHSGVHDIRLVKLVHEDVVKKLPVFWSGMHPGYFQTVSLLEDDIGDDDLMFGAKLKQVLSAVIAVPNPMLSKDSFTSFWILAYSGIDISKDYDFIIDRASLEESAQICVELVLFSWVCLEGWRVNTEDHDILLVFQREVHGDMVRMTCW